MFLYESSFCKITYLLVIKNSYDYDYAEYIHYFSKSPSIFASSLYFDVIWSNFYLWVAPSSSSNRTPHIIDKTTSNTASQLSDMTLSLAPLTIHLKSEETKTDKLLSVCRDG